MSVAAAGSRGRVSAAAIRLAWFVLGIPFGMGLPAPPICRCSSCRTVRLRGRVSAATLRLAWFALGIPFGMGLELWVWTR